MAFARAPFLPICDPPLDDSAQADRQSGRRTPEYVVSLDCGRQFPDSRFKVATVEFPNPTPHNRFSVDEVTGSF
jgi:hypothetical protein